MLERLVADWPVKLLALALGFAIWAAITSEESIRRDFEVAFDPLLRDDQVLAGPSPNKVTVRLEGPASVIRKIDDLELAVRPDLRDKPPGKRDVHLVGEALAGKPTRATLRFFEPDRVSLVLDDRVTRRVPVKANLVGQPPPGYVLYHVSIFPESVMIEGPASQVREVVSVSTEPVTLEGRTQSIIQTVDALADRPQVRIIEPAETGCEVRVEIDAAPVTLRLDAVPVIASRAVPTVTFTPREVSVVLSGPPQVLEGITAEQIEVLADVGELSPSGGTLQVTPSATLKLPAEHAVRVSVKSMKPQRVSASTPEQERAR